jgi:signal transduction histidine kinase
LLDALLALAKSDSPGWHFTKEPANITEIIEKAYSKAQFLAAQEEISCSLQIHARNVFIDGDPEALARMFHVLFDNAVKYTPQGGRIDALFSIREGRPVFEIRDSGIGIPKEAMPHIFERFFQADASRTRNGGGFGLGLAIAQAIANAHQAEIQAESPGGNGSVFRVCFPCALPSEAEQLSK